MAHKGYLGNTLLKPSQQNVSYTKEQMSEYIKCAQDPVYFIRKYMKIIHVDRGIIPFDLYDYQERAIKLMHDKRYLIGKWPRQSGKCQKFDTLIKIRNKKTKEIKEIPIGELFESSQNA